MSAETMQKPDQSGIDSEKQAEKPAEKKSFKEKLGEMYLKVGTKIIEGMENASKALANLKEKVAGDKGISKERQEQINEIMAKEAAEKAGAETAIGDLKAISEQTQTAVESGNPQTIANEAGKLGAEKQQFGFTEDEKKYIESQEQEDESAEEGYYTHQGFSKELKKDIKEACGISIGELNLAQEKINQAMEKDKEITGEIQRQVKAKEIPYSYTPKSEESKIREKTEEMYREKMQKLYDETKQQFEESLANITTKKGPDSLLSNLGYKPKEVADLFGGKETYLLKGNEPDIKTIPKMPDLMKDFVRDITRARKIIGEINAYANNKTGDLESFKKNTEEINDKYKG